MVVRLDGRGNVPAVPRWLNFPWLSRVALASVPVLATVMGCADPVHVEDRWTAMGQSFHVEVWLTNAADAPAAFDEMREHVAVVESTMGYGVEGSLVDQLNQSAPDEYVEIVDRDFYRVLTLGLDYAQFTHGAYDPTVAPLERLYSRESQRVPTPGEIDIVLGSVGWDKVIRAPEGRAIKYRYPGVELNLDRVALGFAIDAASRAFARTGIRSGQLRAGNVIAAWQSPPGEDAWSVPIEDPRAPERMLLKLKVSNRHLAVAGRTEAERFGVIDPRTGRPAASDLLAVIGLADSAADASVLSAALYVLGSNASGDLLGRMHRAEAVMLIESGGEPELLASASLQGRIELSTELQAEVAGRVRYILPPQKIEVELPKH